MLVRAGLSTSALVACSCTRQLVEIAHIFRTVNFEALTWYLLGIETLLTDGSAKPQMGGHGVASVVVFLYCAGTDRILVFCQAMEGAKL